MEQITLDVQLRNDVGSRKIKRMRRESVVPAIVYGGGKDTTPVRVDRKAYEKIRRTHHGENIIFHLNVLDGAKKVNDCPAIVKEEQHHPVTDELLHIDFNQISLKKKITVKVAVTAKGEAIGVERDGGALEHNLWEMDIVCLPTQIPHHIEVNVENLAIGDVIHVKDVVLPEGVSTKNDPDAIVFSVSAPMKEEVATEAPGPTEPEVIKEKKPEAGAEKKPGEGDAKKEEGKKEEKKEAKK